MATASDVVAFIRQLCHEAIQAEQHLPVEGIVVPGSWDPSEGTINVVIGTTGTLDLDDPTDYTGTAPGPDQQTLKPVPVQIATEHTGAKGAPIGMERVILFPYEGGYIAKLLNSSDNTPSVPQGEFHVYLRSFDQNQVLACFLKVGNSSTDIGHAQQVNVLAPTVSLGSNQTQDGNQIARKQDTQQGYDDVTSNVQDAINTMCAQLSIAPPTIAQTTAEASDVSYTV